MKYMRICSGRVCSQTPLNESDIKHLLITWCLGVWMTSGTRHSWEFCDGNGGASRHEPDAGVEHVRTVSGSSAVSSPMPTPIFGGQSRIDISKLVKKTRPCPGLPYLPYPSGLASTRGHASTKCTKGSALPLDIASTSGQWLLPPAAVTGGGGVKLFRFIDL